MEKMESVVNGEVEDLIKTGKKILRRAQSLGSSIDGEELADVASWVTRLGQLIRRLYGEKSQHFRSYSDALATNNFYSIHSNWNSHISQCLGVAFSIKHDLEAGLLFDLRSLVQADVFADFLEMGEYLLNEEYKDAAAVIIGAVLEDSLRKLSERHGLPIENSSGRPLTIDPLNVAMAREDVYNKLVQKQITTWAHIRNKAAHGEYSEYNSDQVQMMLLFVQNFAAEYLTYGHNI